jgi:hypothetical protein
MSPPRAPRVPNVQEGPLEQALRRIVREEVERALAGLGRELAPKAYVSSGELMSSLSISRGTLRGMMVEGLPHTRPGKYPRFSVAEVETWLASRGHAA